MRKFCKTFIIPLAAAITSTTTAHADWDSIWGEVESLGRDARELGERAWEEAKNEWDKLDINHELLQAFGGDVDEQSALVGRFYDLKRPVEGSGARPLSRQQVVQLFHNFNERDWNQSLLENYYSPAVRLYAPYFYLPRCRAAYGPEAFQCNENEDTPKVQPSDWVVIYRGVVTAPKSGTFRFVGMGDDVIMVRFNNKLVLESGWSIPTRNNMTLGTDRGYQQEITSRRARRAIYQYESTPHWNRMLGGIPSGTPFRVQEGKSYPIEILVSEIPGNEFGFCLLIEELRNAGRARYGIVPPSESPTLHLFRTNDSLPSPRNISRALSQGSVDYSINNSTEGPPFREDSLIWRANFDEAEKQGLFASLFGKITGRNRDTAMGTSRREEEQQEGPEENSDNEQNDAGGLRGRILGW